MDVTQPAVREFGLAAEWVDLKICATTKLGQSSLSPAVTQRPIAARVSVGWFFVCDSRPASHLELTLAAARVPANT
jgi:hypothetical protein